MAILPLPSVLVSLRGQLSPDEPDAELIARYVADRDEVAFDVLVRRYARLVWRVARTRCRTDPAAEDVFQATFVVLARKAGSVRSAAALPGWLHRTAYRLAVKAARREHTPVPLVTDIPVSADPLDHLSARELLATVDDEMAKLSDTERSVLVLCGVDSQSLDEAAARLGCSTGAVKGRLERARAKLRKRLDARGLTLPAVALALFHGPPARVVAAAVALPGGPIPPAVEQLLSEGPRMTRRFITLGLVAALVAGGVGTGFGLIPHHGPAASAAPVPKELKKDRTAWGEEIAGLQAGLRMPAGTTVRKGESAELRVVVRNVSREPIKVTYSVQSSYCYARFENSEGVVTGVHVFDASDQAHLYGFPVLMKPRNLTLEPGEEIIRWTVQVRHTHADAETTKSHVELPAGRYQFVMPRIGGTAENEVRTGKLPAFDRLGTGTLTVHLPEERQVNLRAPVPKERGSAALWSEPVKVDWQASRAEQMAGVWTPDGKGVLVPSPTAGEKGEKLAFGGVDVRDADTGKVTKALAFKPNGKVDQMFLPQSLAVSPDGKTVYAAGSLFAPGGKGEAARGLVTWKDASKDDAPEVTVSADPPESPIALSPDGKRLANTAGNVVVVSEAVSGKWVWTSKVDGKRGKPTAFTFNAPDGTLTVGTSTGDWVAIDAKTGRVLHLVSELGVGVTCAATSADGKSLAFGGRAEKGGQALVVFGGKEVHKLAEAVPEKVEIHGLAFSPDGKHLAAACSDNEVRLFDPATGKPVASAKEHTAAVFSVAFSPDGKKLLTIGKDAIKVWDVERLMKSK